ncbi:hypothetical protein F0919_18070 [Taibaiella lutea]|uniref:Uncharacterized protein n=1 Tax=Taibaiella lutea TaxID=2608001 RepID=A0A5M6CC26_9BACT|nr:hypothetical protein [Taibaiella lutea]KAA5532687.1 hypothetical protein F0919_18070 [Taibaiella lutea]
MSRKKLTVTLGNNSKVVASVAEALGLKETKRPYKIVSASINDGFCNYGFEVTEGVGLGDQHPNVKGAGLYKNDLGEAFGKLHVHFACIDDVFKHSNTEIDDIDKFHIHELTSLYHVTSIKIVGAEENETVVITGSKHISCTGGRTGFSTPRIPFDELSSYQWHNELRALINLIREEVSLYKEGKYTLPDSEDEELSHKEKGKHIKQRTILDQIKETEGENSDTGTDDESDETEGLDPADIDLESNRV